MCIYIYIKYIVYVWIALKIGCVWCLHFFLGSYALFMGPANMKKKNPTLKLGPMILFTFLKTILLQYFQ